MLESQLVTENNAVVSPSGLYVLEMIVGKVDDVSSFSFCIKDVKDSSEVFVSNDYYRLRDTTYLLWGEDDTVWVYSGDLGTFYWEKESDSWQKKTYADNIGKEVPQALEELRPDYFN